MLCNVTQYHEQQLTTSKLNVTLNYKDHRDKTIVTTRELPKTHTRTSFFHHLRGQYIDLHSFPGDLHYEVWVFDSKRGWVPIAWLWKRFYVTTMWITQASPHTDTQRDPSDWSTCMYSTLRVYMLEYNTAHVLVLFFVLTYSSACADCIYSFIHLNLMVYL